MALTKASCVLLALLLALGAFETWRVAQIRKWNSVLTGPALVSVSVSEESPRALRFRKASLLAERGDFLPALALYRRLADEGDAMSRAAASFDEGNLLVREALRQRVRGDDSRSLPLLELAKESYRQALREEPGDWDAKYNLELTLRLAPEPQDEERGASPPPVFVRHSEITQRRMTPGLP